MYLGQKIRVKVPKSISIKSGHILCIIRLLLTVRLCGELLMTVKSC